MDTPAHLHQLAGDGARLADAAADADWDAPVPGITWTLREVVVHVGCVHRWSADIVRRRLTRNETGGSASFHPGLPDAEVLPWYRAGLDALITTLTETPDDAEAWMFGAMVPARSTWARRQAHETAIHRVDVQAAAGTGIDGFDAGFARDGLAEVVGFATGFRLDGTGRLRLQELEGENWCVTFADGRVRAQRGGDGGADATVSGRASDLYRWAWNRAADVTVTGDPSVAALWRKVEIT
ncbi:maleylpyruvate isomerase family mycothiol-dependent enzyme [Jatrophihabitans sp. YIM 134969]